MFLFYEASIVPDKFFHLRVNKMLDLEKNCRVAVVQCSPVMFDKDATLAKCINLIKQAGAGGAQLTRAA